MEFYGQATNAKKETIIGQEKEKVEMAYVSAAINKLGDDVTDEDLQEELDKSVGFTKTLVTPNGDGTLNVLFNDTEHNYYVNKGIVTMAESPYKGLTITAETEGVIYTDKDGNTKALTDPVENGDIIKYGDYEYRYNMYFDAQPDVGELWLECIQDGWGVLVEDSTKTEYSELCGNILGKNVKNLNFAFYWCTNLINAPDIPNSVTKMSNTFRGCKSLTTVPTIPSSVTEMDLTFYGCTSLTGTIEINSNPTYYTSCFFGTTLPITLTGSSTMLEDLANTANKSNISVP